MEARILAEYPDATVELIPSSGGVFEVTRDGELIYSKKTDGPPRAVGGRGPGLRGNAS
jgi:predicted Rdx family selenoprotein